MIRHRSASRRARRLVRMGIESLEGRALLSAIDSIVPAVSSVIAAQGWNEAGGQSSPSVTNPSPSSTAMTPAQILGAYNFSTSATAGAGKTIAIVDAYNDPNIQADLAAFDAQYFPGRPAASLTVLDQNGGTNLPATDPSWSLEIALDVEWAHVAAPGANIVLVEANSASLSDLMTAVHTAAQKADVVSMSWGGGEFWGQQTYDSSYYFGNSNVTFVAASGDDGGAFGAEFPANSPNVLSVGGTTLSVTGSNTYGGETAWNASWSWGRGGFSFSGSTGGVSRVEPLPAYQAAALGASYSSGRVVPDVSMDANPSSGFSVYDSVPGLSQSGWFKVGGTSAGAPVWSGLVADADQARASSGLGSLSSTQTLNTLYGVYGSSSSYANDFHDVKSGVNFAGYATTGYDRVTGLGSPNASSIIAAAAGPATMTNVTPHAATMQTVIYVVYYRGVGTHDQVGSTTAQGAAEITAVEIRFVATALAALSTTPAAIEVPAPIHTTSTEIASTVAPGLPNQSLTASTNFEALGADLSGLTSTVYNGLDVVVDATADPRVVPGRGDFPAPPILDPTTPVRVWDEALAGIRDEAEEGSAEPRAFAPWTGGDDAEEDLAQAAPGLLGVSALAFVVGMSWNRRRAEDDDRRARTFVIPAPSNN